MKIAFVPIDNRPVCYNLARDIVSVDDDLELFIPPRGLLGDLWCSADIEGLFEWIENLPAVDCMVLALDTLAYGGLIPSRRCPENFEIIKARIERLKPYLYNKKVYAFSSIMRISNNNYNEEEKEYWDKWGKKIFEYSYTNGHCNSGIPDEILRDYLDTRERNFEINKLYLEWQREGLFDTLIFSKDDCAERGFNVNEARELENMGAKTKTGADEIPLTLLARAIKKDIKIYPQFLEPEYKNCISNYEDVSIAKSVSGQLELGGFLEVNAPDEADIILVINNFIDKQGELVMGWETKPYAGNFLPPDKPYAAADVRFANGADNEFVKQLIEKINLGNFYGYSGWNTSANTLGSLLAGIKVKWMAKKYDDLAFRNLQEIRFLDDWAYQANVRGQIEQPCDINLMMKPYEECINKIFGINSIHKYVYPWNRKFEIEII